MPLIVDIPLGKAGSGQAPLGSLARHMKTDNTWSVASSSFKDANSWGRLNLFGQVHYSPIDIFEMLPLGKISSATPIVAEIISQTPNPTLESETDIFKLRDPEKSGNVNFRKRLAAGEVIVSELTRYKITVNRVGGMAVVNSWSVSPIQAACNSDYMLAELRPYAKMNSDPGNEWDKDRVTPYSPHPWCYQSENPTYSQYTKSYAAVAYRRLNISYQVGVMPSFEDASIMVSEFLRRIREYPQDTGMVTDVLAQANAGDWDILTSLLELDDTVQYAVKIMRRIADVIIAFKKKQLNLLSAIETVSLKPRPNWSDYKYDGTRSDRRQQRQKAWSKYRNDVSRWKREKRVDKKTALDALANLRLEFEYALKPMFAEIKSIRAAFAKVGNLYQTKKGYSRKTVSGTFFNLPTGTYTGAWRLDIEDRCWLKRTYSDHTFIEGLLQRCLISIPVTALELTPILGIVVNWFCNLGDWLSAWNLDASYDTETCTYSRKVTITAHLRNSATKASIKVPASRYYKLDIINPRDALACQTSNNMNLSRTINGFALAWVSLRASVLNVPLTNVR